MAISDAAKAICGRFFPTPGSKLRSGPPHEELGRMRPAIDELVAAGILTERAPDGRGVVEFTGSEPAAELCREHRGAVFVRSLFPEGSAEADGGPGPGPGR